jgi:hypothetical protein
VVAVGQAIVRDSRAGGLSQLKVRVDWFEGKGVRYQKCEAPFGPFRFLVPDPIS